MNEGRIVVVDDNPDILAFMRVALESAGYEVRTASEGGQALALQTEFNAALLITDIFMPGLEGIETIARCKAEFPGTRIIAMSAGGARTTKQRILAMAGLLEITSTLAKPFTADRLVEAVREVLQAR